MVRAGRRGPGGALTFWRLPWAGAIVLATALLVLFEHLLVLTNAVTLAVFAVVDLALWRVLRTMPAHGTSVPQWVPLFAAALAVALMSMELLT